MKKYKTLSDLPTKQIKIQSLRQGHLLVMENGRVIKPGFIRCNGPRKVDGRYWLSLPTTKTGHKYGTTYYDPDYLIAVVNIPQACLRLPASLMVKVAGSKEQKAEIEKAKGSVLDRFEKAYSKKEQKLIYDKIKHNYDEYC